MSTRLNGGNPMHSSIQQRILDATRAKQIIKIEEIQPLWNNYGILSRLFLQGSSYPSVILKHIQIPTQQHHPKGFATSISRQRKIKSYQVEQYWYQHYNQRLSQISDDPQLDSLMCRTPHCIDSFHFNDEIFLLLEDLSSSGFEPRSSVIDWTQVELVIQWLAHFHVQFLHTQNQTDSAKGLWEIGTYWHLATRPDEWAKLEGTSLHWIAPFIDAHLNTASYQTLVHGDAKLANFCFHHTESLVAAVDFQYIGQGCGMKDLAYFVGSVFGEEECKQHEEGILDCYFSHLRTAYNSPFKTQIEDKDSSTQNKQTLDLHNVEKEWRALYPVCWADFQRFLLGWSPHHYKHTTYTQTLTDRVMDTLLEDLLQTAIKACTDAGEYILSQWKSPLHIQSKGYESLASDLVTHVDLKSQEIILKHLASSMRTYQLGVLTEESKDDHSRLDKHAFWAIDPLDGTRYFAQGESGFAVSIALVNRQGVPLIGVVYDPVHSSLYHAIKGQGFYQNGELWIESNHPPPSTLTRYADLSLSHHPKIESLKTYYDIHYCGGAVMNLIKVITHPYSFYAKRVRSSVGGCAIWDIAAVSLMLSEVGGFASFYDGSPIHLNRSESCYFHDVGLFFSNADIERADLIQRGGL